MIKNNELKRNLTMTVLLILMVIFMASAVLAVPAVKAEGISTFGAITPSVPGDGTAANPYVQSVWNRRIESTENLHHNYFAYISIDVRNCRMFYDDALLKFTYYYLNAANDKVESPLYKFSASITFTDKKESYTTAPGINDRKNWEYLVTSGKFGVKQVSATVYITDGTYSKTIYYKFG